MAKSDGKVIVGCKMPSGVVLHLHTVEGEGRSARNRIVAGSEVTLNGNAVRFGQQAKHAISGGFGLTAVDASFWEEWVRLNKGRFPPFDNGLIFAHKDERAAEAEGAVRAKVRSGLEPLPQAPTADDPRVPKSLEPEGDQAERRTSGA